MKPLLSPLVLACLLALCSCAPGRFEPARETHPAAPAPVAASASAASGAAEGEAEKPLDVIRRAYAPHMPAGDPLAFAMKVRAVAADKQGLWRGGKDLFFHWCRGRTDDWLADRDAYVTQQGDQHLGNIGTYLAEGEFGTLGFGMVDFDDSHSLPFQFELLQGVISLRLTAEGAGVKLDDARLSQLTDLLLREYTAASRAAAGGATAASLLAKDPVVAGLLHPNRKRSYARELDQYTESADRLIGVRATRRGEVKEILRPLPQGRAAQLGDGIAAAALRSPESARLFRLKTPEEFRAAVADAALRTRVGSAGSQGLRKYFVLLEKPLAGVDHDVIVYLKQQIPSAPERAGLLPADDRDPAQRCAEDVDQLSRPKPFFNGWCTIGDESYWVTLREPWTNELDPQDVETWHDLLWAARVWAVAAGASHHEPGQAERIAARSDGDLARELRRLSDDFLKQLDTDYQRLTSDPRVKELVARADEAIDDSRPPAEPPRPRKREKPRPEGGAAIDRRP
jgi:uncharacterized protein (DUF2252 family)